MNFQIKNAAALLLISISSIAMADTRTVTLGGQEYTCESKDNGTQTCSGTASTDCGDWSYSSQKHYVDGAGYCRVFNIYHRQCQVKNTCGNVTQVYTDEKSTELYSPNDLPQCSKP